MAAHSAQAQTGGEPTRIEEIVVTAQRAQQSIQTVPVAVTAFDGAALEKHSINSIEDVQFFAPNLKIREEVGVGGLTISIRGISVSADNFSLDTAVGVYTNEVFVARANDFGAAFFDVGSVQVLRGPQGTLFGRNTPVGAVLIESKRPGDVYGGYFDAQIGGGGHGLGKGADRTFYRFEGAVDIPLASTLRARLAGYHLNDDGWARSRATGYHNSSRDDSGVRATLVFEPADAFEATLVADYNKIKDGAPLWVQQQFTPNTALLSSDLLRGGTASRDALNALIASGRNNDYATDHELTNQFNEGDSKSATLLAKWEFAEGWQLRSISGLRQIRRFTWNESDGTLFQSNLTTANIKQTQYSQEFVLSGEITDKLSVLAGLFYFRETGFDENVIKYNTTGGGTPAAFLDPLRLRGEDFRNTSKAVYVNLSYEILPKLTAALGYRFTDEDKQVFVNSGLNVSGVSIAKGLETFSDKVPLYDAKLTWQASPDLLVYAKYGTGYRAGGIGFRAADAQFQPERVKTSEVGAKWDFTLGSVPGRLNAAAFHSEYSNFQVSVVLTGPTRQTIINAGSATIDGGELELTLRPTPNLNLTASLGVIDGGYDTFIFNSATLGGRIDLSGNRLREAPKVTFGLSAGYTVPSSIGEWQFQADYAYTSAYELDTVYQPIAPTIARTNVFHQGPTSVVNSRVKLSEAFGTNLDLSLWVKNLTDQRRRVYGLSSGPVRSAVFAEPRSYGLQLRASF